MRRDMPKVQDAPQVQDAPKVQDAPQSLAQQRLVGVIVEGGVICALLRTTEGQEIALQGIGRDQYPPGAQLQLFGRYVRYSTCRQGEKTFQVDRISKQEAPK